jgi:hypothetical protein
VEGRIDSFRGGIRATFEGLPDAPVTQFTMVLRGGKRGLLVNEKNLCAFPQLADAQFVAQDNARAALKPRLTAQCSKHSKRHHKKTKKGRQ